MKIRLASNLQADSIVDGEGIRAVIWTQGCPHKCKGCHNLSTWSNTGGFLEDIEEVKKQMDLLEGQDGITFSGGEPLVQPEEILELAKHAKKIGLNVWMYTGFLFEDIMKDKAKKQVLKYIDVLVDGPFILAGRSLDLHFKGSINQRVIDVPRSLKQDKVCLIAKYKKVKDPRALYKKEEGIYI